MKTRAVHPLIEKLFAISRKDVASTPDEIKEVITSIKIASEEREKEIVDCKEFLAKHPTIQIVIPKKINIDSPNEMGETALMVAAANNNIGVVQALVDAKAEINAQDNKGSTALMHAKDNPEVVGVLIEHKANANIQNNKGQTALVSALKSLNRSEESFHTLIKATDKLLEATDPEIKDKEGNTALIRAINDIMMREALLVYVPKLINAKNAALNAQDNFGNTPLIFAIKNGYWDIAKHLIRVKADVNIKGFQGETALTFAVKQGRLDIVEMLLTEKADRDVQDHSGKTPLMMAVPFPDILNRLIEEKAKLDVQDNKGNTALMHAVLLSKPQCSGPSVSRLLEAKVDLKPKNEKGESALTLACTRSTAATMALLDACGKDEKFLNEQDAEGNTLLLLALNSHYRDCALNLIKAKADPHLKNKTGKTALLIADELGYADVVSELIKANLNERVKGETALTLVLKRLINNGYPHWGEKEAYKLIIELIAAKANVNETNDMGDTPLTLAIAAGSESIVHHLLNAGADPNRPNHAGDTPLILASYHMNRNMAQDILNDRKANVDEVDKHGKTALDHVFAMILKVNSFGQFPDSNRFISMAALLLSKGAKAKNPRWIEVFNQYDDSRDPDVLIVLKELCKQAKDVPLFKTDPFYHAVYTIAVNFLSKLEELTTLHHKKTADEIKNAIGQTLFQNIVSRTAKFNVWLPEKEKDRQELDKILSTITDYDVPLQPARLKFFRPEDIDKEINDAKPKKGCSIM